MKRAKARVIVGVGATDDLKLQVTLIQIVDEPGDGSLTLTGELGFEWFTMTGNTPEEARENCIGSIAFYLQCRADLRAAMMAALEPAAARGVRKRLGHHEDEEETPL